MQDIDYGQLDLKANPGAFSTLDAEVLVPELQKLQPGEIYLEVGVDRGKSLSIARMIADPGVEVHGVDISQTPELEEYLAKEKNVYFHQGPSAEIARNWNGGKIKVLFIDGDHSYGGCRLDIQGWYPHMAEDGVMLFHDCDESSPGVIWAVAEFVSTHQGLIKEYKVFKRTDKNTSMTKIQL